MDWRTVGTVTRCKQLTSVTRNPTAGLVQRAAGLSDQWEAPIVLIDMLSWSETDFLMWKKRRGEKMLLISKATEWKAVEIF